MLRRESSDTDKEQEARRLLKQREAAAVEGRVIAPRVDKITVAELAEDLKTEYRANGRKSLDCEPRSVAMKMVGHKTESVYRRYAIVDEAMLRDAAVQISGVYFTTSVPFM